MMLTTPLLSKSSFFGSLLNKIRQVKTPKPTTTTTSNEINAIIDNNNKNDNNKKHDNNLSTSPPCNARTQQPESPQQQQQQLQPTTASMFNRTITNPIPMARPSMVNPTAGLKTLEEKIGLPPRPKKPLTPYFRFMQEMRPKVSAQNPSINNMDLVRQLSKQWETVDASVKERLQADYKKDQQTYVETRAKYDAKLTIEQKAELKQMKQDIVEAKERKQMRKRVKELGRPKKPTSAFLRFLIEERTSTPQLPKQSYKDWHKKCTEKWQRLSDDEKLPYMKEARVEIEKYKKEIALWEEKMIRLGNIDVVRPSNLIEPPEPKPRKQLHK